MENLFKNKKVLSSVFLVIVLVASVVAGVLLVLKRQNVKVGAQGVNITMVGIPTSLEVGSNFTMDVFMDTKGLSVTGADLKIRFDNDFFDVVFIQVGDALPVVFKEGVTVGNTAQIVLGSNVTAPKNGTGILAKVTFTAKKAGTSSLSFTNATAVSALGQATNVADTLTGAQVVVLGPTPTGVSTASPAPTNNPTDSPTDNPTSNPTGNPTSNPTGSPAPTNSPSGTGPKRGDVNEDGVVNIIDIGIVIDNYGASPILNLKADLDLNGVVNIVDIGIIIDNYDK